MENIMISPWETEEMEDDMFVPDYINKMAEQVLEHYSFTVHHMEVVTTKPDKGGSIWRIETDSGPKSLKLLHRRPARSLFSLGAQEYLVDVKKARVPPIIQTKTGENYIEAGGKLWFVAQWIEPLQPTTKDLEGARHLCSALGEFHRLSKGYIPPEGAEIASRLNKWNKTYEKVLRKMEWFRNIALFYPELPASSKLLEVLPMFEEHAQTGIDQLSKSNYLELISQGNTYWGLVHQDYGWSNGQMGENGMWIIDLDGVAYDLPIRDLRKLITGTMADLNSWDITWVREMIQAYHGENPITADLYDILLIDFSMPNEFYKNIKEVVYEPVSFLNEETDQLIQRIVETDQTKWDVLEEIRHDWSDKS